MKTKFLFIILISIFAFTNQSCQKIEGCTDPSAFNYNPNANKNTGCIAKVNGCTDPSATNYNSSANTSDGSCVYTGDIVFYQMVGGGFGTTTVNILDASSHFASATITSDMTGTPSCGQSGCANFSNLAVGVGSYSATDGFTNWSGYFTITSNGCVKFYLY